MADSDYHKGDMNIAQHKTTYESFMAVSKWVSAGVAILTIIATVAVVSLH